MWKLFAVLMVLWAILKFVLHKGGYIHMIVIFALSILVVQLIAESKKRYYNKTSGRQ
ncbi:MAG TPA: hypothetical protein VLL54_05120 [Pyrinomonadaceae bacterium]|nr:hypothetical protein [Pyrinomonadaceae bacterium]